MPKIVVKDLTGNTVFTTSTLGGESAEEAFNCILEQEGWIEEELFNAMGFNQNNSSLNHSSWHGNKAEYDDNTVIEVLVNNIHSYNLSFEY